MSSNQNRGPKDARRDAAREQAAALRDARLKKERRTRALVIGAVVAVVAIIVVAVVIILGQASKPEIDRVARPANTTEDAGISVGASGAAGTADPEGATVLKVYSDYMCPVCGAFEAQHHEMLAELRGAGDLVIEYHPISILDRASQGTKYSTRATQASATVADGAPEAFVAFHDALFANQPQEGTGGLSDEQLATLALGAGVPQAVVDRFGAEKFEPWVRVATSLAFESGVTGTPTLFIDGVRFEGNWRTEGELAAALQEAIDG